MEEIKLLAKIVILKPQYIKKIDSATLRKKNDEDSFSGRLPLRFDAHFFVIALVANIIRKVLETNFFVLFF